MTIEGRLLFSLAHPDDESFGSGGTIAHYTAQGTEVHLICSTNGDVGTVDEEFLENFDSVAELRLYELNCAAEVLGFKSVHTFGYRDSGMQGSPDNLNPDSLAQADIDEVTGRVVQVMREVRPQVVVTFDPMGGYGHPDHIAMNKATIRAFNAAGDEKQYPQQIQNGLSAYQPQKLYFTTFSRKRMRWMVRLAPLFGIDPTRMGANKDMNLKEIAQNEWPTHARIKVSDYEDTMRAAWDCHASQAFISVGGNFLARLISIGRIRLEDTFMRVQPGVTCRLRETDLFEGVDFSA